MELRDALTQIAEIRSAVAATERFRGYRAIPVGFTGALAVLAAAAQPVLVPQPLDHLPLYFVLWFSAALTGLFAAGWTIIRRDWQHANALRREVTKHAVAQFLPCLAAGLLITIAVARHASEVAWMLPGLWQIVFSLGVFASCRLLPRATVWVGVWYLLCGIWNIMFSVGESAFAPWAMGVPFGVGQGLTAAILYWNLERTDG